MISITHARKEISRLDSKLGYPTRSAELGWLVDSLRLGARSKAHASLVISEALDVSDNCPQPDDIRKLCANVGRHTDRWPPSCDKCRVAGLYDGTWEDGNWVLMSRRYRGMEEICGVTRCSCPRGRLLAAKDAEEQRKMEFAQ